MLCAAARIGIGDALGDEVHSVGFLAENCQADADALYRLLRALASIGVTDGFLFEHILAGGQRGDDQWSRWRHHGGHYYCSRRRHILHRR
jgi:hypothetical protein